MNIVDLIPIVAVVLTIFVSLGHLVLEFIRARKAEK